MYKVTLFDRNCPSCCSGTAEFYCDNIDDFEKRWLARAPWEHAVERFRRSKNGECVTDYYSDAPELDIVQYDGDAEIYREFIYSENDAKVELHNSYGCEAIYYLDKMAIQMRAVKFKGEYILQAKYSLEGICMKNLFGKGKYRAVTCWGNRVLEHRATFYDHSDDRDDYKDDLIESFVYFPFGKYESKEEMDAVYESIKKEGFTDDDLDHLMTDIPGEAG